MWYPRGQYNSVQRSNFILSGKFEILSGIPNSETVKSNKNDIVDNLHEPFVEKGLISNKIRAIFFENKIYNF